MPKRINPHSQTEMLIDWGDGEQYAIPYVELRFACACAGCVDEMTGQRTLQRTSISPEIRPTEVIPVGRYAVQIFWSDHHSTGIYTFERLRELCQTQGRRLSN